MGVGWFTCLIGMPWNETSDSAWKVICLFAFVDVSSLQKKKKVICLFGVHQFLALDFLHYIHFLVFLVK